MREEIRTRILDAAEARFRSYGFGKTTMAEIAEDIDMSTANLYRFYENKLDIGSAMALRSFDERERRLSAVVEDTSMTAAQRLQAFVLEVLAYMHSQFSDEPKISELVDVITRKRPDLVQHQVASDKRLMRAILEKGQQSGEFVVGDIEQTAQAVLAAIAKFSTPFFVSLYPYEELQQQARAVVDLVLHGLERSA